LRTDDGERWSLNVQPVVPITLNEDWNVISRTILPIIDKNIGSEQWAIGPTVVALKQTAAGWTYGALRNHLVSVAGDDDRADVNATFSRPFLSKALCKGRTVTLNLESAYDFENHEWSVPFNTSYSKVTKIGGQMLGFAGGFQ
jgi:hypothetical protein